jgi:hypothetical protein
MKGFGSRFHSSMNSSIAAIRSGTLEKLPPRTALLVSSANQRSTMFNQLELVGTKWTLKRGWRFSQRHCPEKIGRRGDNELSVVFSLGPQLLPPRYPIRARPPMRPGPGSHLTRLEMTHQRSAVGLQAVGVNPLGIAYMPMHGVALANTSAAVVSNRHLLDLGAGLSQRREHCTKWSSLAAGFQGRSIDASSPHLRPIDVHSRAVNWYSFLQSRRTSPPRDAFRPEIGGRCRPTNICARSAGPSHSCGQWRNASCRPPARNAARVPPVSS